MDEGSAAATGQPKVKIGFDPLLPGFLHVPFNDVESLREAVTDKTAIRSTRAPPWQTPSMTYAHTSRSPRSRAFRGAPWLLVAAVTALGCSGEITVLGDEGGETGTGTGGTGDAACTTGGASAQPDPDGCWAVVDVDQPRTARQPGGIADAGCFSEQWGWGGVSVSP